MFSDLGAAEYRIRFDEDEHMYVDFPCTEAEGPELEALRVVAQGIANDATIPWVGREKRGSMGGAHVEAKKIMMRKLIGAALKHYFATDVCIRLRRTRSLMLKRGDGLLLSDATLKHVHGVLTATGLLYTMSGTTITPRVVYPMSWELHDELGGAERELARHDDATYHLERATIFFSGGRDPESRVVIYRDGVWGEGKLPLLVLLAERVAQDGTPWRFARAEGKVWECAKLYELRGAVLDEMRLSLLRRVRGEVWIEISAGTFLVLRESGYVVTFGGVERPMPAALVSWAFHALGFIATGYRAHGHNLLLAGVTPPQEIVAAVEEVRRGMERVLRRAYINDGQRALDIAAADGLGATYIIDDETLVITFRNYRDELDFERLRMRRSSPP